jgi:hypothetical protein
MTHLLITNHVNVGLRGISQVTELATIFAAEVARDLGKAWETRDSNNFVNLQGCKSPL